MLKNIHSGRWVIAVNQHTTAGKTVNEEERVYVSLEEAARIKGCSLSTVRRRIKDGTLPARSTGPYRRWEIPLDALIEPKPDTPATISPIPTKYLSIPSSLSDTITPNPASREDMLRERLKEAGMEICQCPRCGRLGTREECIVRRKVNGVWKTIKQVIIRCRIGNQSTWNEKRIRAKCDPIITEYELFQSSEEAV